MSLIAAVALFGVGLGIVLFSAEQLVKGVVGTSAAFGVSSFTIAVVFIGFDPDNLSVGAAAAFEHAPGLAWGAIIGAAMVAVAFAFGLSAVIAPMRFERVPGSILMIPIFAIMALTALGIDGELSRFDGVILLATYAAAVAWIWRQGRRGVAIQSAGEVGHTLQKRVQLRRWQAIALLGGSLGGIVVGSEMVVAAAGPILERMGLSETAFGMTILAFLVSIEELAREVQPALRGRPDISFANVLGSILAMLLFNAGVFALVAPIAVPAQVLRFYLPYSFVSVVVISAFMARRRISRRAGALFIALYGGFVSGAYFMR